jgi:glucosamine--fructose-6-phosphate aminotransferase (isomerizing)
MTEHYFTADEILSQPEAWAQALEVVPRAPLPKAAAYEQVLVTGCGSAYYLALSAAALYQELTGRAARAVPAGDLLLNPQVALPSSRSPLLLIAISRSGTTTETVKAVQQFKSEGRGQVVVISVCDEVLSRQADVPILIPRGQEQSVAQTRSFASMYVAAAALCARMADRPDLLRSMSGLPEAGRRLLQSSRSQARDLGANLDFDRFYFLGSGLRYGLACEANLKMKEMTLTHSEPFHFLEFRHGPMSMAGPSAVVVGLLSDKNRVHESAVLEQMKTLNATTFSLAESEADIAFSSGVLESVRGVLYLPTLQLMALERSLAKGLNPDRPENLTAVVHLSF